MIVRVRPATPEDVDFLIHTYEQAYRGGYSACFDRYGAIGPEDFWWVQSEKAVSLVEVDRAPAGLLVLGKDRTQLLVEELLLARGGAAVPRIYDHIAGQFTKARQDRILLRAAESNAAALALAEGFQFAFVNALVVASGAARQDTPAPAGYTIRRATPEDARQVARLTDELGTSAARLRRKKPKKDETQSFVWVAERDRYAAGFAEVRLRDGVGWWTAGVREGHRGKGIGSALAGAALEFCHTRRVKPVTVYWALDPSAGRLAHRLGATTERTYLYLQKTI
ncbi:MAG TPA: GNAT family N-acetyltransferase [bacterium]|jgi:GNAT superfamily N-acetyltransferase|nr:GNAT family N-acetyltransferase [bacterium]